jgi:Metallo-beta-lactamase superfamily
MKFPRRTFLHLAAGAATLPAMSGVATAQTELARPRTGTRVITLGTSAGPPPRAHRAQSSNLLIVNGAYYVVDAGDGTARRIAKAGINVRDIGTIFLTHHHDDHTAGLGTLMSVAWDNQRTQPINVYGPPSTEDLVKAAVQYFSISAEIRIADGGRSVPISQVFFGHDVRPGTVYQDANVKVTAGETPHFEFHTGAAAGKYKSYVTCHFQRTRTANNGPAQRPTGGQGPVILSLTRLTPFMQVALSSLLRCACGQRVGRQGNPGVPRLLPHRDGRRGEIRVGEVADGNSDDSRKAFVLPIDGGAAGRTEMEG